MFAVDAFLRFHTLQQARLSPPPECSGNLDNKTISRPEDTLPESDNLFNNTHNTSKHKKT